MSEILGTMLIIVQCTVGIISLISSVLIASGGDYARATYHLGWAILMCVFLVGQQLKKGFANDN